jgi:glycosyltransferase involved in cell wall biosynthesis
MFSLIVPVYRNEDSIPPLIEALEELNRSLAGELEVVLVVDGSPDRSLEFLASSLPKVSFLSQLLVLSRNFGAFSAIAAGLASGRGDLFAIMAADLQEPPELILEIRQKLLTGEYDVVVGTRTEREDPIVSRILSSAFWKLYRALVQRDMPRGGADVFGCTREFKEHLLALSERNTTLVGLAFWLGFRRGEVSYRRSLRRHGKSAWTFPRKLRYFLDSTFAFSDLPVRLMSLLGMLGIMIALILAGIVVLAKLTGRITVPGYSATAILIVFFGGLNSLGLGLIGEYVWRTFENTKSRPPYIVAQRFEFKGENITEWKSSNMMGGS